MMISGLVKKASELEKAEMKYYLIDSLDVLGALTANGKLSESEVHKLEPLNIDLAHSLEACIVD